MNNIPPQKMRRMALIFSGSIDALLGAFLLLTGFELLPIDVTQYGFENWHAMLFGGIFFIVGVGFVAYNLSRLEE
jgi:ABC-type branched-subunit amino acid transport system permease subunit